MSVELEFAEEYSLKERIRIIGLGLIIGMLIIVMSEQWLFPAIKAFAESAPCRKVFGIEALSVLWYGLFTGMPLFFALMMLAVNGWVGFKTLRDNQYPPLKQKVFKPTKIVKGAKARWRAYWLLSSCLPLLLIGLWGYGQAKELSKFTHTKSSVCLAQDSG